MDLDTSWMRLPVRQEVRFSCVGSPTVEAAIQVSFDDGLCDAGEARDRSICFDVVQQLESVRQAVSLICRVKLMEIPASGEVSLWFGQTVCLILHGMEVVAGLALIMELVGSPRKRCLHSTPLPPETGQCGRIGFCRIASRYQSHSVRPV
jgi:hypothetical protein